jgi:hypothetical protein
VAANEGWAGRAGGKVGTVDDFRGTGASVAIYALTNVDPGGRPPGDSASLALVPHTEWLILEDILQSGRSPTIA